MVVFCLCFFFVRVKTNGVCGKKCVYVAMLCMRTIFDDFRYMPNFFIKKKETKKKNW